MDRVQALVDASVDCIVIDSAHGHSKNIITTLKNIKSAFPDLQVIAGNIATGAAAKALCEAGVDLSLIHILLKRSCRWLYMLICCQVAYSLFLRFSYLRDL